MTAMHPLPQTIEGTPPATLVLAGDDRGSWELALPLMEPVFIWWDRCADLKMVRWRLTPEVMTTLGIPADARCAEADCACGNVGLLHCDDHDVYLIDTNWHQTGWCFA